MRVQFNEARYGRSNGFPCGSSVCSNTWFLVRDAANQWVSDQLAAGRTPAQVKADMQSFDLYDRYDFDGDGNFNEPDGYIDHFQIVHAGGDQADGDPFQGEDAIWSHRWYAFVNNAGLTGPSQNPLGGTEIAGTGIWIGDYTIQPENGGRSVFFHEFGHDLGLPDDYNILSGGDNNNEHWTLMAQSRLGAKNDEGIGERAGDLGAWNKLQLGWLDYETVVAGQKRTLNLGPQEFNTKKAQAAVVVLPEEVGHHRSRCPVRRREAVLLRQRGRPQHRDDQAARPDREDVGVADVPGPVRHRGRVRLLLRRSQHRRHELHRARRHGRRCAIQP